MTSPSTQSYDASFERIGIADDSYLQDGKFVGQEFPLEVQLKIHPNKNGIVVINYPGCNGDIDGYNNKYGNLANYVREKIGTVLRTDNPVYGGFEYKNSVQDNLRAIIDYALQNAPEISGINKDELTIYLMGFSAGASAIAAVAHEYPQVKKILLMAPSGDAGMKSITEGLSKYSGECNIVVGENDEIVGPEAGNRFAELATSASLIRNVLISNCDHQFRGETNGRIMSAAPLWAFSGIGGKSPSPEDGIKLYD